MPVKKQRLIFELSAKEKEAKLKAVLSNTMRKAAALNLPFVYRNELCIKPNLFIHKYPDGRTELIEQNPKNFSEKIVRILS